MKRVVQNVINSRPTSDGVGVKLFRALSPGVTNIDPFLMLDEISSDDSADYMGGFPSHPHRGFETVTYMLKGKMRHKDHLGNEGILKDGSVQWMTAGRGVIHSEMPEQTEGVLHGFQLWVNLPSKEKMKPAAYQEFSADEFSTVTFGGANESSVKVITGEIEQNSQVLSGPVKNIATDPKFFDVDLKANDQYDFEVNDAHTVLVYCFEGTIEIAGQEIVQGQTAKMGKGDVVSIKSIKDARFLFLSAKPIGEPVVSYGPFVMNTEEEIRQAIADYYSGQFVA